MMSAWQCHVAWVMVNPRRSVGERRGLCSLVFRFDLTDGRWPLDLAVAMPAVMRAATALPCRAAQRLARRRDCDGDTALVVLMG